MRQNIAEALFGKACAAYGEGAFAKLIGKSIGFGCVNMQICQRDTLVSNADIAYDLDKALVIAVKLHGVPIGGVLAASFKTIVGGELAGYTEMMNEARMIATKRMIDEAEKLGADAIIGVKYASSAIVQGAAEVLAYGTAVKFI